MLSGLELTFMGLTRSYCDLFSIPGFIVSPVGKGERRKKNTKGKEGMKEEGIKNDGRKDKKKEF